MEYAAHRPRSAAMQRAVLELLCSVGTASVKDICYYTGASAATVKRLETLGYVTLSRRPTLRCRQIRPAQIDGPVELSGEQIPAYDGLCRQMMSPTPGAALLYGVTGSGKTAVYLKLIRFCLDQGKSAMLLVPEIGLTPQLLSLLAAHFGETVAVLHSSLAAGERYDQWKRIRSGQARVAVGTRSAVFAPMDDLETVAVLHSSLAAGERYDQWKRIRSGQARVAVGTRSAVFAPMDDLGIIILDEEQEHTYKSENSPRYSAKEIAI